MQTREEKLQSTSEYYAPSQNLDQSILKLDHWWIHRFVKGPRVLEMGCSDGTSSRILVEKAPSLEIIEGSVAYCELTRKNLAGTGAKVTQVFFEDFSPSTPFDDIVFARSLDYIEDPVGLLKRVSSWLAPEGRLHLVVQNAASLHRRLGVAMGVMPKLDHLTEHSIRMGHRRVYDKGTFVSDLEEAGLKIGFFRGFFLKPFDFQTLSRFGKDVENSLIPALQKVSESLPDEICCQFYALCNA